ncbi:MAG TPA: glycoside hydrolase family 3 C-terminal domain-containing protein [Candidatus Faecimorpha stercoravium]|nr:glycoside hydrolase family 3 C-terminal domain-containing protein [Candidatus Faecimorpha stercoravium]
MKMEKYRDESLSFEERAKDLLSRMTLEEKLSQMTYQSQPIERLGIPAYNWWNEALHGVARAGTATMFPQAIGLAAMFDDQELYEIADIIATEGRAKYKAYSEEGDRGIYKGLTFWSPNVNIFRDPRWGRGHETYGEDPYLTSRLGVAFVKGLQGDDPKYLKTAACAKHYAVHSGPEGLRHEFDAQVSQKDLWETYLPAFEACVKEGHVEAVMGAYNRTNGEPCCGSPTLLQKILRDTWGFQGHVVSDCWAIMDFHTHHHVTATAPESAAVALKAGCDVNCGIVYLHLQAALDEGRITEEDVDRSLLRLLITRMKLGMFDQPEHVPYAAIPVSANNTKAHQEKNLRAARKSLVLLKNDHVLPLCPSKLRRIAVIGPNADSREALKGNYYGDADRYTTVLEGIQNYLEGTDVEVAYSLGCVLFHEKHNSDENQYIYEATGLARYSDAVVVCLGLDDTLEGEERHQSNTYGSGDKPDLKFPGQQERLLREVLDAAGDKPVILVNMTGSAMDLNLAEERCAAIIQAWYPGSRGGQAIAELLFGEYSPAGRLPVTFYRTIEELPEFTDYRMTGRTYRYMKNDALYPFGYGLSYNTYRYDAVEFPYWQDGKLHVRVRVTNQGTMEGDEVVQLYTIHKSPVLESPNCSLRGFQRITLEPGASQEVEFILGQEDLMMVNNDGEKVLESGEYEITVGGGQPDHRTEELTGQKVLRFTFWLP